MNNKWTTHTHNNNGQQMDPCRWNPTPATVWWEWTTPNTAHKNEPEKGNPQKIYQERAKRDHEEGPRSAKPKRAQGCPTPQTQTARKSALAQPTEKNQFKTVLMEHLLTHDRPHPIYHPLNHLIRLAVIGTATVTRTTKMRK